MAGGGSLADRAPAERLLEQVRERMADDLDAPPRFASSTGGPRSSASGGGDDPSAPGIVSRMCDALLGVAL